MTLPLTEKYRPSTLKEIHGNPLILTTLSKFTTLPHLLFYGPPGCGKTTTIRALAKTHFKPMNILELNASNERGIAVVRQTIKGFCSTNFGFRKLVILDEADSMTRDAQNALRRIIEDFAASCTFCLIANYANRIVPAVQSRLCRFRFGPVGFEETAEEGKRVKVGLEGFVPATTGNELKAFLQKIIENEKISISDSALNLLLTRMDGDLRKLINDLEALKSSFKRIEYESILEYFGLKQENEKKLFGKLCSDEFVTRDGFGFCDCEQLVKSLGECVVESKLKRKMEILKGLADCEYAMGMGCSQSVQSGAVSGIFYKFKD